MKDFLQRSFRAMGFELVSSSPPADMERAFATLASRCAPFTMTPAARLYGLFKAVEYIVAAGIGGDIVECGVWRGGSCMLAALALSSLGCTDRDLYLYDTFAGMTQPGANDVDLHGNSALEMWRRRQCADVNAWCYASLEEVARNMASTGYPADRVHLIEGDVLETIPARSPDRIAILRLDTDFYETTKHTMANLFPRLSPGGVLIVDDYGHWQGAKKAVDECLSAAGASMLLNRLDYSARIGVKR